MRIQYGSGSTTLDATVQNIFKKLKSVQLASNALLGGEKFTTRNVNTVPAQLLLVNFWYFCKVFI